MACNAEQLNLETAVDHSLSLVKPQSDFLCFDDAHHLGEPTTCPLAGWRNLLAALRLMKLLSEGLSRQKTAAKSLLILAMPWHDSSLRLASQLLHPALDRVQLLFHG